MKILMFTDSFFPQINGLVIAVDTISSELSRSNSVYIISPTKPLSNKKNYKVLTSPGVPFFFLPEYKIAIPFSIKLFKFLFKEKFDIIHTHTPFSLGILGLLVAKIRKIPIIHSYHTYFEEYLHYVKIPARIGKFIIKIFSRVYCNLCDRIIVPSQMMKNLLISYGVYKEIIILPTGIDVKKFRKGKREWLRKKFGLNRKILLLYVGRLAKEKNIFVLLNCIEELKEKYKNIVLLLVGDGPLKKRILTYVKSNGLDNYVKITGFIKPSRMKDVYAGADIFVFPSLTETQGLSVFEALASGLPVVAFKAAGLKYLLPDKKINGISPVKTYKQMLSEIEFYLENLKHKKLFSNNLKKFVNNFSLDNQISRLTQIYKSLISE